MKIHLVRAELFHVERRKNGGTYMTKLLVAFRNSTNAPKNYTSIKFQFQQ
jgi:hypothetical protein